MVNKDSLGKNLCDSIAAIVDQKIKDAKFDTTTQMLGTVEHYDRDTKVYTIQYQDAKISAYALDPCIEYPIGAGVQIFSPQGDISNINYIYSIENNVKRLNSAEIYVDNMPLAAYIKSIIFKQTK